jgi:adenylate kinase family enzyme
MMKTGIQRIHIFGASGCGVSTLGKALAQRIGAAHLDTDDFYWLPTNPPFREKRSIQLRLNLLNNAFILAAPTGWVLSGSLDSWGGPLVPLFKTVIFLEAPTEVRLERLRARQLLQFGADAIAPGGWRHGEHTAFLEWAAAYEEGNREGRSRPRHEAWISQLPCPVLRLDGTQLIETLVSEVMTALRRLQLAQS